MAAQKDQKVLLDWGSTKQKGRPLSTMEAELEAAVTGMRAAMRVSQVVQATTGREPELRLYMDSQAGIAAMKKGFSASVAHRKHGAFISFLKKYAANIVKYVPTSENVADIFTKPLGRPVHDQHLKSMGFELIRSIG
eukprot:Lankesteria_metandrocarpae@DN5442_c0_g1_i1.p1